MTSFTEKEEAVFKNLEALLNREGVRGSRLVGEVLAILADWSCRFNSVNFNDREFQPTDSERVVISALNKIDYRSMDKEDE